jgi:glucan phosphoethanolaminetransferase (alkaline phosphatase superfamily)
MKKKTWWIAAGALLLLALAAVFWPRGKKAVNWNVLLITLDTTRADRLGAYGCRTARTPNLDRLAAEGVLFENAHSSVPLTLPLHRALSHRQPGAQQRQLFPSRGRGHPGRAPA